MPSGLLPPPEWYETEEQLLQPLLACYWSLWECGGGIIAEGRLLDLLRRVSGAALAHLDCATHHAVCLTVAMLPSTGCQGPCAGLWR